MDSGEHAAVGSFPDGLLPNGAVGVVCIGIGDPATLYPEETVAIARAAAKRSREFAAGRASARLALERLGEAPAAIPIGVDRAPRWPEGIVGSISHSDRYAVAAVAYRRDVGGLGIDVESSAPLAARLCAKILSDDETRRLASLPGRDPLVWAKIAFSAKESLYKCYRPIAGSFLAFHDVDLEIFPGDGALRIRLIRDARPDALGARSFEGRYAVRNGYVFTAVALPPSRARQPAREAQA